MASLNSSSPILGTRKPLIDLSNPRPIIHVIGTPNAGIVTLPNPLQAAVDTAGSPEGRGAKVKRIGRNALSGLVSTLWPNSVAGAIGSPVQAPDYPPRPEDFGQPTYPAPPVDPNSIQSVVDAVKPSPSSPYPDQPPMARAPKPGEPPPYGGPDQPAWARGLSPGVLPPDPNDPNQQPAVTPASGVQPPALDPSGLPGTTSETATGALSLDDYIEKMKKAYPDLDFTNPKQAEADANARRDLDRTAMLAQLSLAAGMVKGAGTQWEGLGQGMEAAGQTYDKGFQKYQQALQDSADRYGKQMEAQMTYDTARRQAALGLYTTAQTQAREDQRTLFTETNKRRWDIYKEQQTTEREGVKLTHEDINKYFDKNLELYKPASDPSTADPVEEERKAKLYRATLRAREASIRLGKIVPADNYVQGLADK